MACINAPQTYHTRLKTKLMPTILVPAFLPTLTPSKSGIGQQALDIKIKDQR
jgi:hypothetical protein